MGYYNQMKQGVASRLSRKAKSPKTSVVGKGGATGASGTVMKNAACETDEGSGALADGGHLANNEFSGSAEDLDLEVNKISVSVG